MEITLRIGGVEKELVQVLLRGSYRGWNETDLLRTLAEVALRQSLQDHVSWEPGQASRE